MNIKACRKINQTTALFVGIALLASGCAVMTVDVDVYKGPLVNHEDVQLEQVAVMAIGSRPLLIGLRNSYEFTAGQPANTFESHLPGLTNASARQVQAVLSLFDKRASLDSLTPELQKQLAAGTQALDAYQEAYERLYSNRLAGHPEILGILKTNAPPSLPKKEIRDSLSREDKKTAEEGLKAMRRGYRRLLTGDDITSKEDAYPQADIFHGFRKLYPALKSRPEVPEWETQTANSRFTLINQYKLPRKHAEYLLHNLKTAERDTFARLAADAGASFHQSRVALEKLWVPCVELLRLVNTTDKGAVQNLAEFNASMADFIARLSRPAHVAAVFELRSTGGDIEAMGGALNDVKGLADQIGAFHQQYAGNRGELARDRQFNQVMSEALKELLVKSPVQMSQLLLRVHRQIPEAAVSTNIFSDPEFKERSGRRYGLARGPTFNANSRDWLRLRETWTEKVSAKISSQGFESGRLPEGLSQVVENYIAKKKILQTKDSFAEKELLQDEMARFATKVLLLANNSPLMYKGAKADQIEKVNTFTEVLQAVGNSILVQLDELKKFDDYNKAQQGGAQAEMQAAGKAYTASGKVLLVQIQEWLSVQQIWVNEGLTPAEANSEAITRTNKVLKAASAVITEALKGTNLDSITRANLLEKLDPHITSKVKADIRADVKGYFKSVAEGLMPWPLAANKQPAERKDVVDQVIAVLQYQKAEACRIFGPESAPVKSISNALAQAYERRTGLIYLRPASAYLRSSYPSTTYQQGTEQGWKNMLGKHANNSANIFDFHWGNKERHNELLNMVDRLAWQRVNSIKVSGGGKTSYVLVQDDIGNWYVKNYSSNPSNIIHSAQTAALLMTGAGLPAGGAGDPSPSSAPASSNATLDAAKRRYREETLSQLQSLTNIIKNITNQVATTVVTNAAGLKPALEKMNPKTQPLGTDAAKATAGLAEEIRTGITALTEFYRGVHALAPSATAESTPIEEGTEPPKTREQYLQALKTIYEKELDPFIKQRKETIQKYQWLLDAMEEGSNQTANTASTTAPTPAVPAAPALPGTSGQ